jgi:hypothetical protein
MSVSSITRSRKYPGFIRNHPIFKSLKTVQKVFPKIGLKNCEVSVSSIDPRAAKKLKSKKIVFSSDGDKGLWDIATMSMRGIESCQSWNEYYCNGLIGSMVDPYAGIIYVSGNRMRSGSKMEHRCVVRLVVNMRTKKPAILLERTYHCEDWYWRRSTCTEDAPRKLFAKFIEKKLGLPVIINHSAYRIPLSKPVAKLKKNFLSYRDSHIAYGKVKKTKRVAKYLV